MKHLTLRGSLGVSEIVVGERLRNLSQYVPGDRAVIITDARVGTLFRQQFPPHPVLEIGQGEEAKTLDTVRMLYEQLVELEADRSCFVVGIGGGIVCDVTGFVASTFLRGLDFGLVPTTLLSQVDASVGGKNGVNLGGYKNMVGVFNQPRFVLCDPSLLACLPAREIRSGLAEVVKHALIGDASLFDCLEAHPDRALRLEPGWIQSVLHRSLAVKAAFVGCDERESGPRRTLNFGHTLGHAVERCTGLSHGQAVAAGMAFAVRFSAKKGFLPREQARRIQALLKRLGLPHTIVGRGAELTAALRRDKKREGSEIHFVFLEAIGRPRIGRVSIQELETMVEESVRPGAANEGT